MRGHGQCQFLFLFCDSVQIIRTRWIMYKTTLESNDWDYWNWILENLFDYVYIKYNYKLDAPWM